MAGRLVAEIARRRPELVVMEGTGIAGGAAMLLARQRFGIRYVVSCGDAVAPFVAALYPGLGPVARVYERLLFRRSAAVIGWTPYLVGRAISLGAPRAMTAANWAAHRPAADARAVARQRLGIPAEALVFGLVGSLERARRLDWCYGDELVRAIRATARPDLRVLIVGDGSGLARLRDLAGDELGRRVLLPGRCPPEAVGDYLAAMDIGSLPQTIDAAGALRYTSKLSEYLASRLPVVTGQLPLAYDLDDGWIWRLPGNAPWDPKYIAALAELMESLTPSDLLEKRSQVPAGLAIFDGAAQRRRVGSLVRDLLDMKL
jgi:glycosyltransferase involved in cell wall biosynthesis